MRAGRRGVGLPRAGAAVAGPADDGIDAVLSALAAARQPGTTLAVTTYDDPLPGCRLAALSPLARQVLEGSGSQPGLDDLIRATARRNGAVVVETRGQLSVPAQLAGDCLHPSTAGHATLAAAVDATVGPAVSGAARR